jgi:hypothetical protein
LTLIAQHFILLAQLFWVSEGVSIMPSFLIGFKENNPAEAVTDIQNPVTEQIPANPARYFRWQTFTDTPSPNSLKQILYLIRQAYPDSSSLATDPTAVNHTIKTKFHLYDSINELHYFIVKTGSFYDIHARVKAPARLTELPSAEKNKAEDIDESDIESILAFYPLKKFKTFTRLNLDSGEPVIPVFTTVDENLLPAKKLLDKSKTRLTEINGKLESGKKLLEEASKLLAETKPVNSSADAEAKRYEGMLASLAPQINSVTTACLALNSKYSVLETKLIQLYEELMEDDEDNINLRHSLIGCLWACALHYGQSHIDFHFGLKPMIEFQNLFKQIASIDDKDYHHITLNFNPKLKSLSFTELQDLTNDLLAKLYKAGGLKVYLGYQWSEQIKFLTDIIKTKLAGYAQINPQTNQFSWKWSVVSRDDETITKALKTLYHRDLASESSNLDTLIDKIATVKSEISAFNKRNIEAQEKLTQNHSSITSNVSDAKNVMHEMKDIYSISTSQINALQQVVQQLVVLATQFSLPFSSIEEIITQAEALQTSMEGNLSLAQEHKTEVFVTGSIASKVEQQKQELTAKLTQLKEMVKPLTDLNSHVTSMQTIINDQLPITTSKDNLILITRKFVNMLADIEYFQSKVTWGGGTRIESNGKNYVVQESYSKLLRAKQMLTEPLNSADVVAFWSAAKTIAELAKKRGTHRYYFFKVRSDEMQALLKLIEDLDIDHIPSPHHIDKQLDMIKPDWRSKQEPSSISMRPDPALSPSFRSSLSLSLVRSFSLSSASAAGGDEEPEEFKLTPPPTPRRSRAVV